MTETDAKKLVNRLSKNYNNLAADEHMRVLLPWRYDVAVRAIEEYIDTCDYPSIPKLKEAYMNWYKYDDQQKHKDDNQVNCYVCMDAGVVVVKETFDGYPNTFCYWCDKCRTMNQNEMVPISSVLDPIEIEQSNKMLRTSRHTSMPVYITEALEKFCRKVRIT